MQPIAAMSSAVMRRLRSRRETVRSRDIPALRNGSTCRAGRARIDFDELLTYLGVTPAVQPLRSFGMKRISHLSAIGALVLACAAPLFAQNNGVSANGTFQFSSGGAAKTIFFDARAHPSGGGAASGEMTFSGPAVISGQDVDGDGTPDPGTLTNLTVKVKFACLAVNGNRA